MTTGRMVYLTINYTITPNPKIPPDTYKWARRLENVLLRTPDMRKFYRPEGGLPHFYLDDYEIVEIHGYLDDWDEIENLILDNARHHRPIAKIVASSSPGWLSPDGRFYPCGYTEHDCMARRICRALLGVMEGARHLERRGWFRVSGEGYIAGRPASATQRQLDTLWDMCQVVEEGHVKRNLRKEINRFVKGD